jgi:hypothetical protein
LAGLQQVAFAATILQKPQEAERLAGYAAAYWNDILRSLEGVVDETGQPFLPATPNRRIDSGAIGSLCAVYPLNLLPPEHPRVLRTVKLLKDRFVIGAGLFQNHFHSGINCYLSAHLAQCCLANGDPYVWKVVHYLLKHASGTYTWPEAFHPVTDGGCMGEGHHGWASAEWLLLLRNLLFLERGDELWLLPALRNRNLSDGGLFRVDRAPSNFGTISFILSCQKKALVLDLLNDFHLAPPKVIRWKLPFTPSRVVVDQRISPNLGNRIEISANTSRVVVIR